MLIAHYKTSVGRSLVATDVCRLQLMPAVAGCQRLEPYTAIYRELYSYSVWQETR